MERFSENRRTRRARLMAERLGGFDRRCWWYVGRMLHYSREQSRRYRPNLYGGRARA